MHIVDSLLQMLVQIRVGGFGSVERLVELDLAGWGLLRLRGGSVEGIVSVVDDLEGMARHLAHSTLQAVAVRARLLLATVFQNLLGDGALAQCVHVGPAHAAQISPSFDFVQQDARAVFAYAV